MIQKRLMLALASLVFLATHAQRPKGTSQMDQLKVSQIEEVRKSVWDEWCRELAQTDTLQRMLVEPLSTRRTYHWTLPETLEPHAVMNFYAGTKGEKPAKGFPLFVYLHGSGPREGEWNTGLQLAKDFDDAPSMYVIPQIPNEGKYYRWWQQSKQWAWGHLLKQMLAQSDIDPSRIYLFGISEGGYGSQRLASFYADYLAGAAPMAGGEPLRNAPSENLCHTAFSFVTGEKDAMFYRNQLTMRTKERMDSLKLVYPDEFNYRVELEPGKGHHITYGVSTPWLKTFQRVAQPHHFRWENYEMDGLKRNCFYNLEVLEECFAQDSTSATTDSQEAKGTQAGLPKRVDYEFSIKNNKIELNVREVEYIITETDSQWGIELNNTRKYTTARHGKVRIYLSEELANLGKTLTVYVNGEKRLSQKPQVRRSCLQNSCRLFGDPLRLFPVALDVEW